MRMCNYGVAALVAAGLALSASGAVIKEDYAAASVFGFNTSGLYDFSDPYVIGTTNWVANLRPARPTALNNTTGVNFFSTLSTWATGTGWTFASAVNSLSDDSLVVRTYDVQGTPGRVGAEFHVEYVPHGNDPTTNVHWIQVVTDNHKLGTGGGHGIPEMLVDNPFSPGNRAPYYDDGGAANGSHFYDAPWRADGGASHTWDAELYLATGPAAGSPGLVTLYRTGISWGWENTPAPGSASLLALGGLLAARRRR